MSGLKVKVVLLLTTFLLARDCLAEHDWRQLKGVPGYLTSAIEIATNGPDDLPAHLYLTCSQDAHLQLLLSTRIPSPARRDRFDEGGLYDGTLIIHEKKVFDPSMSTMPLMFYVVRIGPNIGWFKALFVDVPPGEPDTIITPPLAPEEFDSIAKLFEETPPPVSVSVGGIDETGVYMEAIVPGTALREFRSECQPVIAPKP